MSKQRFLKLLLVTIVLGPAFVAETAFCTRAAVIDFESIGDDPTIGRGVTEIIRTELIKTGKYEVVERALLNKILQEQQFQVSDLVDPSKVVELGKMLGADLILTGSVVKIGTSYTINARFIDVKTGVAKRAEAKRGKEIDELTDMCGQLIDTLEGKTRASSSMVQEQSYTPPAQPTPGLTSADAGILTKRYVAFSVGGAGYAMQVLNEAIGQFNDFYASDMKPIESGPNLGLSGILMINESFGIGLATSFMGGNATGEFYTLRTDEVGTELGRILTSAEIRVAGVTFAVRPIWRHRIGKNTVLALGVDIGGISLNYSEETESILAAQKSEGTGSTGLFGGFAAIHLPVGRSFFLGGDIGFRSAKGEVELELSEDPVLMPSTFPSDLDVDRTQELDFSGGYMLLTAGLRF